MSAADGDAPHPPSPPPSRRAVLAALVAGGAALLGVGVVAVTRNDEGAPDPGADVSVDAALVALGRRYLDAHPDEADEAVLLDALPALGGQAPSDPATQLAVLSEQVAADYADDDLVVLDGWILARTEGRAAALYALGS